MMCVMPDLGTAKLQPFNEKANNPKAVTFGFTVMAIAHSKIKAGREWCGRSGWTIKLRALR